MILKLPEYKILVHENTISILTKYTFRLTNSFKNANSVSNRPHPSPSVLETWSIQHKDFGKNFKESVE